MSDNEINRRLDELEAAEEREDLTIEVQYTETILTACGDRIQRSIPARYDENVPFEWIDSRRRVRVRYPLPELSHTAVPGGIAK